MAERYISVYITVLVHRSLTRIRSCASPPSPSLLGTALLATAATSAFAGEVVVSAAASLTNAFKDAAQGYEAQYPGSKVSLNFAASGVLLQQIVKGAPVDVFASADQETMDAAQKQGLVLPADRHGFRRQQPGADRAAR